MADTHSYIQKLLLSNPLREPILRTSIKALQLPSGSCGLDVGCGIGLQALLLAEEVGPEGQVTGLDISPEFLSYAQEIVEKAGFSGQITFQEGNMHNLPFEDKTFDWVWSADCAGYHGQESRSLMKELARVVKPGGMAAILIWSSQQLLPGYPLLEARLNATLTGTAPFTQDMKPESHYLRALGWFREAGLENVQAHTFVQDVQAPLSEDIRKALKAFFDMRWGGAQSEVSSEDWADYQRLCQPESPDFILDLPDYYAFFTYSLFQGRVIQ